MTKKSKDSDFAYFLEDEKVGNSSGKTRINKQYTVY